MKEEEKKKKKESRICFVASEEVLESLKRAEEHFTQLFSTKPSRSLLIRSLLSAGEQKLQESMTKGRLRESILPALDQDFEVHQLTQMSTNELIQLHNQLVNEEVIEGISHE